MVDWSQAACVGHDPELWFSDRKNQYDRASYRLAITICATCPIAMGCLLSSISDDGILHADQAYGIWGGLGAKQRRRLARMRFGKRKSAA